MPLNTDVSDSTLDVLKAMALDAVVAIDARGDIVLWNELAEQMFGWAEEEVRGRALGELIVPHSHREAHARGMQRFNETGIARVLGRRIEITALDKSGREFPIELAIAASPPGGPSAFVAFLRDISDRRAAQSRLALSEESLRLATESAEIGTWDLDLTTQILTWSQRTKAMFGISPDVPCSMEDFYAGLHPDDLEATRVAFLSALDPATRATYDVEYRTVGKEDGLVRWVAAKGKGIFNSAGVCVRAVGTAIDITRRKHDDVRREVMLQLTDLLNSGDTAAALDRACALMGEHFTASRVGFGNLDPVEDIFSYTVCWTDGTVPPLLGEFPAHVFGPQIVARLSAGQTVVVDNLFESSLSDEAETRQTATDVDTRAILVVPFLRGGRLRTIVYLNSRPVRHWTPDEVAFMEAFAERTRQLIERSEAEAALAEVNSTLEQQVAERTEERDQVWRNAQDLLVISDRDGTWLAVSPSVEKLLGWKPGEMIGRTAFEFIVNDDVAATEHAHADAIEGKMRTFENRFRHKTDGFRWLSWVAAPSGDRIYASGRDTTAEHAAAEQLALAQEALRQSQKMEAVGQLTGGIAHDFNNMLAVVMGSLELLSRRVGNDDPRNRHYVQSASDAAKRAANLTQRLLAFSRQQPLQPASLDPNRLVLGMSELLRHSLGADIQLETVMGAGIWRIEVDPNQLENVILNLAVNARDAMPEGGKLTLETQNVHLDARYVAGDFGIPAGQYVLIAMTDTGTGMPADVIAKAFDPFFTTKEIGKGTGLGLSQVYGFVRQSGGHVKLYSELGEGTTIKIYLPRGDDALAESKELEAPAPLPGDDREVILVVDDEPQVRQFSIDALTHLGYRVLDAENASTALRILVKNPDVTLLFTDVVMPEINGRKLVDEARKIRPDLKVLYTTGYTRNAVVHNGVLDKGVDLISKPFTIDELATRVRTILDAV